jgi:hypothetical protein
MAAPPVKAFSGKVESAFPSENAAKSMKHFQEMLARVKAGVKSGFVGVIAAGERNAMPRRQCPGQCP